ncbi:uncharacterized protein LOC109876195 [Oncorhynchus kisutch]|uniref:uncharacterized protein LOC109876195 n=1 Tax=Oncorhynchus kisutch TaxID=8019 RepID=UPI0012DCBBCE|nr:uncharacterized protein LOC109876195 [Oncorhynchus kisutch]
MQCVCIKDPASRSAVTLTQVAGHTLALRTSYSSVSLRVDYYCHCSKQRSKGIYILSVRLTTALNHSMKHRCLPHLPTITETLEDSDTLGAPGHLAHPAQSVSQSPSQCSQSLEEYMTSIQALARPVVHPSCGPVRLQRTGRPQLFSKSQMKHSVSALLPRGSPRAIWTSTTTGQAREQLSGRLGMERECGGKDPMEWLYGQTHT